MTRPLAVIGDERDLDDALTASVEGDHAEIETDSACSVGADRWPPASVDRPPAVCWHEQRLVQTGARGLVALLVAVLLAAGASVALAHLPPPTPPDPSPRDASEAPEAPACDRVPPLDRPPVDARVLRGELGPACPVAVYWFPDQGQLHAPVGHEYQPFALGRPGDIALIGDWDCDGADTLALYRPATGGVHQFDDWAEPGKPAQAREGPTGVIDGQPRVRRGHADACDEIAVVAP